MCLIVMYNYKSTKIYFPVNYIDVCSCCFSFNQTASAYLKTTNTKHKQGLICQELLMEFNLLTGNLHDMSFNYLAFIYT